MQNTNNNNYNTNPNPNTDINYNNTDYHHDQSTVTSPTNEHLHEKHMGPHANGAGDGFTASTPTTKLGKFTTNFIVQSVLRGLQFISAITLLGLASTSLHQFIEGEPRMRFTVFCASFALLYLIIHLIMTYACPQFVLTGVIWICEVILTIVFLCSFIAIASRYAGFSCSFQQFDQFGNRYNSNVSIPGCHSAKAAIAFAGLLFVLFALSTFIFGYNVVRRTYSQFSHNWRTPFNHTTVSQGRYFINYPFMDFREAYNPVAYDADQHTVGGDLENQNGQYADAAVVGAGAVGAGAVRTAANQTTTTQSGTYSATDTYNHPTGAPPVVGDKTTGAYDTNTTTDTGYANAAADKFGRTYGTSSSDPHSGQYTTPNTGAGEAAGVIREGDYGDRVEKIDNAARGNVADVNNMANEQVEGYKNQAEDSMEKPQAAYQKGTGGM